MYIQNKTSVSRREQKNFLARVDKSWNHVYNPSIYHVKNPLNVWMIIMQNLTAIIYLVVEPTHLKKYEWN